MSSQAFSVLRLQYILSKVAMTKYLYTYVWYIFGTHIHHQTDTHYAEMCVTRKLSLSI